jgi:DNA-binding XRE family transcriptional regulator
MSTLENYINRKCGDPGFRKLYEESCEICRVTVELIDRMYQTGLSKDETARKAGVTLQELSDIEEGEKCSYVAVLKLCRALDLPEPKGCRKKDRP